MNANEFFEKWSEHIEECDRLILHSTPAEEEQINEAIRSLRKVAFDISERKRRSEEVE